VYPGLLPEDILDYGGERIISEVRVYQLNDRGNLLFYIILICILGVLGPPFIDVA